MMKALTLGVTLVAVLATAGCNPFRRNSAAAELCKEPEGFAQAVEGTNSEDPHGTAGAGHARSAAYSRSLDAGPAGAPEGRRLSRRAAELHGQQGERAAGLIPAASPAAGGSSVISSLIK